MLELLSMIRNKQMVLCSSSQMLEIILEWTLVESRRGKNLIKKKTFQVILLVQE